MCNLCIYIYVASQLCIYVFTYATFLKLIYGLTVIMFYRLVRLNKRFRAIFSTLAVLLPQILNIILLLLLIYYFFAIIGMEIFQDAFDDGCCR